MTPKTSFPVRPSNNVIALLLPGYSPDLGWMARAIHSRKVILDDLHPFSRKSKVHRTKIRTPDGHQWLTIPFVGEDRRKPIRQVRIDSRRPWLKHHIQALEYNYRNSLYFDFYEPEIRSDLEAASEYEFLLDAVRYLMMRQWTYLELGDFPVWISNSNANPDARSYTNPNAHSVPDPDARSYTNPDARIFAQASATAQRKAARSVINILQTGSPLTGDTQHGKVTIWQEADSKNYQKPHPDAVHPVFSIPDYHQHFPGFVPGCGALDLLFEYGPDAWQIFDRIK